MLRIEFKIGLAGIPAQLFDIEEPVESVEIDNALPVAGDMVFLFLTASFDSEITESRLSNQLSDVKIVDVTRTELNQHMYYLSVMVGLSDASVLSLLTENRAIPHRIVGKNAHLEVVASVQDWTHLKHVATAIEDEHGSLELMGTTQTDRLGFPLGGNKIKQSLSGKLSSEQLEVLETAYQMGYFKVPQEVTAEEIANELDISRSTLSARLRRVEHNFCALLFGPQE
ncbi:helix-turn-helix domain-containing protein [Natrialbaceae archaeon AArc-T1-2]|uniref:helix-turn-helix domain-containing protein n=1 Tax=Natrialbaceae archaeon AArc-T1-2 TaxID=3053904 RepID=UPI00255ADC56|nr:helix-turn-helix domain-containing protein [Natrialbaceae archaeon AArc-T1-2]WIV68023.1 helix-turn-helix domain-containing protein [Natrialbaceae archaeon AArc-T1-2]